MGIDGKRQCNIDPGRAGKINGCWRLPGIPLRMDGYCLSVDFTHQLVAWRVLMYKQDEVCMA